jgi:hypothetical protein
MIGWELFIDFFSKSAKPISDVLRDFEVNTNPPPVGKDKLDDVIQMWIKDNPTGIPSPGAIGISLREFRDKFEITVVSGTMVHNQAITTSIEDLAETMLDSQATKVTKSNIMYKSPIDYFVDEKSYSTLVFERQITWLKPN